MENFFTKGKTSTFSINDEPQINQTTRDLNFNLVAHTYKLRMLIWPEKLKVNKNMQKNS